MVAFNQVDRWAPSAGERWHRRLVTPAGVSGREGRAALLPLGGMSEAWVDVPLAFSALRPLSPAHLGHV